MTRLPINLLLYVCSAGLAAGSAWTFYDTMTGSPGLAPEEISSESSKYIKKGREQTPGDQRDLYGGPARPWWDNFLDANLVGHETKKADDANVTPVEPEEISTLVPVEEILDVVGMVFDSSSPGWCVVRYKPHADVTPPRTVSTEGAPESASVPDHATPADVVAAVNPGRPGAARSNRGRNNRMSQPRTSPADPRRFQVLEVGASLWPSYSDIKLSRIQPDGRAVFFSRDVPGQEDPLEEKLLPNEFGLPKEYLEAFANGAASPSASGTGSERSQVPAEESGWVDVTETKAVRPGQWHISKADDRYLRENAQTVFNEDFSARSYSSRSGSVRGVQITRISPRLERFGIRSGDVVIELNGVKVSSKAQALREGKRMYKQGVRTFRAKILTGYGRIEERTYHAPNS